METVLKRCYLRAKFGLRSRRGFVVAASVVVCFCFHLVVHFVKTADSLCLYPHTRLGMVSRLQPGDNTDVTIVTAFFDVGDFRKGSEGNRTSEQYMTWSDAFQFLQNPLVVFTDSDDFETHFAGRWLDRVKSGQRPRVRLVPVQNRSHLPAFRQLQRMRRLFEEPSYPKFYPNTVFPEYSCSQHAKMDVVEAAILQNDFNTKYYAWLDVGYFRHITREERKFWIAVPPDTDDWKITACEVKPPEANPSAEAIFTENRYWVGGGMTLGAAPTFLKFIREYRQAFDYLLGRGLASTDQQVIYAMMHTRVRESVRITTELQLRSWRFNWVNECWFYLGYTFYRAE